MLTTDLKARATRSIHPKQNGTTFFRKAGEDSFFGTKSGPTFFKAPVQAKLSVSTPDDPQEKEADAVADKVMRMPETVSVQKQEDQLQRKEEAGVNLKQSHPLSRSIHKKADEVKVHTPAAGSVQRSPDKSADKEMAPGGEESGGYMVSRKNSSLHHSDILRQSGRSPPAASIPFEQTLSSSKGGGSALPDGTKQFMEHRFGADFSGVRVHTDATAQQLSRSVNAQAFAHGNDIYFNSGKFSPDSTEGKSLLAHELTHTIQQGVSPANAAVARKLSGIAINAEGILQSSDATHLLKITRRKTNYIQKKSSPENPATDNADLSNISGGYALPSEAREYFQSSFKTDVGDIKIHTDFQAAMLCQSKHTPAFVEGQHVFFAAGRYSPESEDGGALLAKQVSDSLVKRGIGVPGMAGQLSAGISEVKAGAISAAPKPKSNDKTAKALSPKDKKKAGAVKESKGKKSKAGGGKGKNKKKGDSDGRAFPKAKAKPNKAPATPQEDPAFHKVVDKGKATSKQQKQHDPADLKATDAQKSATAVPKEAESHAQDRKTSGMDEAGAKDVPFDAASFKADLLKKIESVTPHSLEEATEFKENNKIGEVKTAMNGKVSAEKENSTGPVSHATAQPLQVNEADNKQPVPLPPTIKGMAPAGPSPKDAAPKNKLNNEISLQDKSKSLDDEMKANNVTEDQLTKSNEPDFAAALSEKKGAQKDAADRPIQYKKDEAKQLNEAKSSAQEVSSKSLAGMYAARGKNFDTVVEQQKTTKQKDEERRANVSKQIEEKYQAAEKKVNETLAAADTESAIIFDQGSAAAQAAFENEVAEKMRAYKRRRYSGFWGGLRWAKDKLFGMPDEVNTFYTEGRQNYLDRMDKVITQVANAVTAKLNEAKQAIKDGKKAIDDYVKQLPADLADLGKEAASGIQDKFDSLEQSVNDKRDQLIDGLAKKYVDNVKKLDDRISEMKEANQGLVDKAIGFLKKVWKVIKDLTNLFTTILSKLASIIGTILSSPSGFFDNLARAFKIGFNNFKNNFLQYLEQGLMSWLVTNLGIAGVEIPEKFSAAAVFTLALQVMGITKPHIRERAVAVLDEEKVSLLEGAGGLIYRVFNEGLHVIWDMIVEKLTDFKDLIWEAIKSFIQKSIIEAALTFILSMLNPIGAFIKVCMAIYDFLMMLVKFKDRIIELLDTVLNAVTSIASGAVDGAAKAIEGAFAKSIPVIIGFLAALLHLNNITSKIRDIILRVQKRVEKALDWVILKAWSAIGSTVEGALRIKQKGKEMLEKGKNVMIGAGSSVVAGFKNGLAGLFGTKKQFVSGQASHSIYFEGNESHADLVIATTPKKFLDAVGDRETEISLQLGKIQDRTSVTSMKLKTKLNGFLQKLREARVYYEGIETIKNQIIKETDEKKKAAFQRDIFTATDSIKDIMKVTGVSENDFALEIISSPVAVGDKILYQKRYYKVNEIILTESKIKANPININTGEAIKNPFIGNSSAMLKFEDFDVKFSMAGENVPNLSDEKLLELNYDDGNALPYKMSWNKYEGEANKVLNHRAHNFQRNPSGHQWEHLVEQSSPFGANEINSVNNIYLAKQADNFLLGQIFGIFTKARDYLTDGSDSQMRDELVSSGNKSPREYLKSKSIAEHRRWKNHFYKKIGIAPNSSDKNIDHRGPFRTMNNAEL